MTTSTTPTELRAYAWLPEGTIGIGAIIPRGAFMIATAPLDDLYQAIRATARHDAVAPGCYSLPGSPADPDQGQIQNPNRAAVTAFLAYRKTIRAYLNAGHGAHSRGMDN